MMARGAIATTNIIHIVRAIDARKIMKSQYEATIDLSLLATFVTFVAFSSHLTIDKE
jgi:hypothetical protein